MSSFSDYTENLVLTWLFTNSSATRPTAWYVGLFTAAPSDTGGGTEVTGNAYARVLLALFLVLVLLLLSATLPRLSSLPPLVVIGELLVGRVFLMQVLVEICLLGLL